MITFKEEVDLKNHTLILPAVAVGNVGQLTVDLIISSLQLRRIGLFSNSSFIPVVGTDPYDENSQEICTSADLYHSSDKKVVVLQIRSPVIRKLSQFYNELKNFIKYHQISKVVLLTSSYSHEIRDVQLKTVRLRYIASTNLPAENTTEFNNLNWIQLEPKVVDYVDTEGVLQIPGGGFAKCIFQALEKDEIPCAVLLKFCSEGDNIPDAIDLLNYLNQWLLILSNNDDNSLAIKYPSSWKFLFGNSPPSEIY
ncbi:proteasome assembly chaperone 2 [Leptopilina heterotoma]|uniref:proteasome assembly chaperone 2 n=1 Tax=Leptopilina heterotoma TaxID=63436 RepID=UPI001CA8033A|nr:proteasome assembly chaperone 2 [Leptopilina heterotoma]